MYVCSAIGLTISHWYRCACLPAENVGRLKQLEYLNLALNNIERIENLEGEGLDQEVAQHNHR